MIWLCWPLWAPWSPPALGLCPPVPLASSQSPPCQLKLVPETPSTLVAPSSLCFTLCWIPSSVRPQPGVVSLSNGPGAVLGTKETQATSVGETRHLERRPPVSACIVFQRTKALPGSGQREAGTGGHWSLLGGGQAKPWRVPQAWELSRPGPPEPASHSLSARVTAASGVSYRRQD